MGRLYFGERRFREIGLDEANIATLRKLTEFVEAQEAIAAAEAALETQGDAIDAANTDITAANAAINALDARIDTLEAAGPYVEQDGAAAPSYTAYAGQDVSAAYVEAEVQAIDDAVAAIGTALDTLIDRLQTANVLS